MIEYVILDVSGTILHKPTLFGKIKDVLDNHGYNRSLSEIKYKHKLLSEVIKFPDRTDEGFYKKFNTELLYLLGIIPNNKLVQDVFSNCSYLPWEKYEDTEVLDQLDVPVGILSNFNTTLRTKLGEFFGPIFRDVFVSEEMGVAKPQLEFYEIAVKRCGIGPEKILYIGDSIKLDLEPALKIGMKALLIDRDAFYESSDHRISSLKEILLYL